jgi:hypothetical protein
LQVPSDWSHFASSPDLAFYQWRSSGPRIGMVSISSWSFMCLISSDSSTNTSLFLGTVTFPFLAQVWNERGLPNRLWSQMQLNQNSSPQLETIILPSYIISISWFPYFGCNCCHFILSVCGIAVFSHFVEWCEYNIIHNGPEGNNTPKCNSLRSTMVQ